MFQLNQHTAKKNDMTEQFITSVRTGDTESLMSIAIAAINRRLVEAAGLRLTQNCPKTTSISIVRLTLTLDDSETALTPMLLKLEYVTDKEAAAEKGQNDKCK
jgi:hypothetical protein